MIDGREGAGEWRALVSGESRQKALSVVGQLVEVILAEYPLASTSVPPPPRGYALGSGYLGHALLLAYTGEALEEVEWKQAADRIVTAALVDVSKQPLVVPGLFGHAVGLGWVTAHLARQFNWFEPVSLDELDSELMEYASASRTRTNYDLISGLVGIGLYGLERLPSDAGFNLVQSVVGALALNSMKDGHDLTWMTPPSDVDPDLRRLYPAGLFNFGVAHGIPGVIGFLARVVEAGVADDRAIDMLRRSTAWLVNHRLAPNSPSVFSARTDLACVGLPSRMAWCYGDPGILPQLFASARVLGDPAVESFALAVGVQSLRRVNDRLHGVIDPALCHGSSGLLQVYNRLWQSTGDTRFRDFAVYWLNDTLARREVGRGAAGFPFVTPDPPPGATYEKAPEWQLGFLEGISGIGLAMLAAASSVEPQWDRLLLTDLPIR